MHPLTSHRAMAMEPLGSPPDLDDDDLAGALVKDSDIVDAVYELHAADLLPSRLYELIDQRARAKAWRRQLAAGSPL
jgi:hypothetical protein